MEGAQKLSLPAASMHLDLVANPTLLRAAHATWRFALKLRWGSQTLISVAAWIPCACFISLPSVAIIQSDLSRCGMGQTADDAARSEELPPLPPRGPLARKLATPLVQVIIISFICFCTPGIFNANSGMGGG